MSLYEEINGKVTIPQIINCFFTKMLACENLKEFFKNTDLETEKQKQIDYFTTETGGP
jgi:truncated hemoglobin YjbI